MIKRFRFFSVLLLLGALAITQESFPGGTEEEGEWIESEPFTFDGEIPAGRALPGWAQRRWFRSNKGGMALEEIPSGLTALRNEYALFIDFTGPEELPELLLPFYVDQYIEVRILYENREEARRQWIFRDEQGLNRLVAVFVDPPPPEEAAESDEITEENPDQNAPEAPKSISGFIEIYNENLMLAKEYLFFENGDQRETEYTYAGETLIRAETYQKSPDEALSKLFTDNYRYNRSHSLRFVERLYHDRTDEGATRISFPNRVIDAAADENFITEKLYLGSDSFGSYLAEAGQRMIFNTDDKGRILIQTLVDEEDGEIWVIKNTWSGDRITSSEKIQGEDRRLNEYEYSDDGDLVEERNYHNGILERQVRLSEGRETEELFVKGVAVLRAVWEDGRKISEERIREQ